MDFLDFIHVLMLLAHASLGVRHAHLMASPLLAHASPHALLPTWCGITAVDGCGSGHLARQAQVSPTEKVQGCLLDKQHQPKKFH